LNDADLTSLAEFTVLSRQRFLALQFIAPFAVSGKRFNNYLGQAYEGYPFVVSVGVSEFSRTQLLADLARMKKQLCDFKSNINSPTLKKMIFVEMRRDEEQPSPFVEVQDVMILVKQYTPFFKSSGLKETFDAVISAGGCKTELLSMIPMQLLEMYPYNRENEIVLPSISSTTAAAMLCFMMKQQPRPSVPTYPSPCVLFANAWRLYAAETPGAVNITGSFRIGDVNFTICSLVEKQVHINHCIAHCVNKSSRFVVDDMTAELEYSGTREHGKSTSIDAKTAWKVDSQLLLLFAVKDSDYKENLQPRFKGNMFHVAYILTNFLQQLPQQEHNGVVSNMLRLSPKRSLLSQGNFLETTRTREKAKHGEKIPVSTIPVA